MSGRNKAARILVAIGIVLFASAALHSLAAYPRVSTALGASNLNARLQEPLRAVFLLVGWDWIVIAIVALLAAFTETKQDLRLVLRRGRSGRNGIDSGLHRRVSRQRDDWFGGGVAYGWRPSGSERPP